MYIILCFSIGCQIVSFGQTENLFTARILKKKCGPSSEFPSMYHDDNLANDLRSKLKIKFFKFWLSYPLYCMWSKFLSVSLYLFGFGDKHFFFQFFKLKIWKKSLKKLIFFSIFNFQNICHLTSSIPCDPQFIHFALSLTVFEITTENVFHYNRPFGYWSNNWLPNGQFWSNQKSVSQMQ